MFWDFDFSQVEKFGSAGLQEDGYGWGRKLLRCLQSSVPATKVIRLGGFAEVGLDSPPTSALSAFLL